MTKDFRDKAPAEPPAKKDDGRPKNYLEILSNECRDLAARYRLTSEQADHLRQFVTDVAMKAWRNGRAVGWIRGQEEAKNEAN